MKSRLSLSVQCVSSVSVTKPLPADLAAMQRWAPPDVFCDDDPAIATTTMHDRRLAERRPSCSVSSQSSSCNAAFANLPNGSSGNQDVQIDAELDEYRRLVSEIAGSTAGAEIRMYHGKPTSACGVLVSRAVAVGSV